MKWPDLNLLIVSNYLFLIIDYLLFENVIKNHQNHMENLISLNQPNTFFSFVQFFPHEFGWCLSILFAHT